MLNKTAFQAIGGRFHRQPSEITERPDSELCQQWITIGLREAGVDLFFNNNRPNVVRKN